MRGGVIYVDQNAEEGAKNTYKTVEEAVKKASNGDTINIAEGNYDISNLGIKAAVNLKGKGPDKTVLEGQIIYSVVDEQKNSINVEGIKFEAKTEGQNLALCWGGSGSLRNYELNVDDCVFEGYKYGVCVNSDTADNELNITECKFNNVFCAVSVKEGNTLNTFKNVDIDPNGYAVQGFGSPSGGNYYNGYYYDVDNFKSDENHSKADWDAQNYPDDGSTEWPASVKIGNKFYEDLQNAINDAEDEDVIVIFGETEGAKIDKNIKNLTIQGTEGGKVKDTAITMGNNINIRGLTIEDVLFENSSIQFSPNANCKLDNMKIINNEFTKGTSLEGISAIHFNLGSKSGGETGASWDNLLISGNEIKDIEKGSNSGILIIGDEVTPYKLTIKDNIIDGTGWNGIQLNNVKGSDIVIEENEISNCEAGEGILNLYMTTADSIEINENKLIAKDDEQLYICYISDDIDAGYNFWGYDDDGDVEADRKFADKMGFLDNVEKDIVTEPYYEKESMEEEDLNTYEEKHSTGSSYSLEEGRVPSKTDDEKEEETEKDRRFIDVDETNPYYTGIMMAVEKGYMTGTSDITFSPDGYMTRAMACQVLYNKAGCPEVDGVSNFLDVTSDKWYAKAVAWCEQQGIVVGYGNGYYGPEDYLTENQLGIMLGFESTNTNYATRGFIASKITE